MAASSSLQHFTPVFVYSVFNSSENVTITLCFQQQKDSQERSLLPSQVSEQVTLHQHTGCWLAQTREQKAWRERGRRRGQLGNVFIQLYHYSHHTVQPHPARLQQLKDPEETSFFCQDTLLSSRDREFLFPGSKGNSLKTVACVWSAVHCSFSNKSTHFYQPLKSQGLKHL